MKPKPASILLVDDEAPARRRLRDWFANEQGIRTILHAETGAQAIAHLRTGVPDVVLLDMWLPDMDGTDVVSAIGSDRMPPTVVVSAHSKYAVIAFDFDAVDYLLKPYSDARLALAWQRLLATHLTRQSALTAASTAPAISVHRLPVDDCGTIRLITAEAIEWIAADDMHVRICTADGYFRQRIGLAALLERLDVPWLLRIHRSTAVNIACIIGIEPVSHGEFDVLLPRRTRLRLSRTYRADVERRLGQRLPH